jgi:NADP-dependent 3-hydroxy acid dehydrogenase YdfG
VAGMHGYPGLSVYCATKHAIEGLAQVRVNLQTYSVTRGKGVQPLLKSGAGCILMVSSVAGMQGYPGLSVYFATKHAIEGLAQVRVNLQSDSNTCDKGLSAASQEQSGSHTNGVKCGGHARISEPLRLLRY